MFQKILLVLNIYFIWPLEKCYNELLGHGKILNLYVNIFAWRLLRYRLPTVDNLIKRRVLQPNSIFCLGGCGFQKDIYHLFLVCDFYRLIWYEIYNWVDLISVKPAHAKDHIIQFCSLGWILKTHLLCFLFDLTLFCLDCLAWPEC